MNRQPREAGFEIEVFHFLRQLGEGGQNENAFDELPFAHWYLSDRKTVIHCVPIAPDLAQFPSDYWMKATDDFINKGLKLIHLWEDAWRTKPDVVQSRLRALVGQTQRIPARLTQVRRIDKPTLDAFLNQNHLQNPTTAKFKYGLFLPERYYRIFKNNLRNSAPPQHEMLVGVASFSSPKTYWRAEQPFRSAELIRFANLLNCTVVGGVDKLLKHFQNEQHPDDIMTYADRDWSDGRSYERLSFELIQATPPQSFYVNPVTFERVYGGRLVGDEAANFVLIHNAGSLKYLKKLK